MFILYIFLNIVCGIYNIVLLLLIIMLVFFFFFYMFVGIDKKINKWKLNYFYVNDFVIFY